MKKIFLIIEREFLTRVKKKSFIITTILVPLLMAGVMVGMFLIQTIKDDEKKKIVVIDQSGLATAAFENTENITFDFRPDISLDSLKANFKEEKLYAIVSISELTGQKNQPIVDIYSFKQINLDVQRQVGRSMEQAVEEYKLNSYDIQGLDTIMASIKTNLNVKLFVWDDAGKEKVSNAGLNMGISYVLTFIIYFFIFLFGNMVMTGVIEEKSSRIIEVIVSSVKPFQLMMGKIIGIASVGLLQFLIWIILTFGLVLGVQSFFLKPSPEAITQTMGQGVVPEEMMQQVLQDPAVNDIIASIASINFVPIILSFFFFFLFGYLLYASMFAAVGSAVEKEADTQQLVLPITIPLMIGLFLMLHTFQYPNSSLSFWSSMVPFTSPMVMMARVPFGVPLWEIALSLSLLFITFVGMAWFAGKIYRTGILMYGKKPSLKEMWKWLKYKN